MSSSALASIDVRASRVTGGRIPVSIEQVDFSCGEVVDAPCQNVVMCFIQTGSGNVRSRFDGCHPRQQHFRSGMFLPVTPPDTRAEFYMSAPMRHLVVSVPVQAFECWVKDSTRTVTRSITRLQETGFEDPLIEQIVMTIWSDAEAHNGQGSLLADALVTALTGALVRRAAIEIAPAKPAYKLSKAQVQRVETYLAEHVASHVTIAELAAISDMQERSFSAAFKNTIGKSPYQRLMDLRIEIAKSHLGEHAMSISQIAEVAGFADQAHLTSTFTRRVGMSPGRYRRIMTS